MNTFPLIIVESKLGGKEDVPYELRRRGFVVQSASMRTQSLYTLVTLSKKLIVKLSIQENVPLKSVRKDSLFTSLKLANAGIAIIMRATSIGAKAAWVAHDEVAAAKTTDNICTGSEAELMSLCNYYGPNVALKHGLVLLNRYYLQALALVGLIMVLEYRANSARSMWTPVYAAFLALWGSFHLQRWRQRRSALSFLWGVFCGAEEAERDAEATEKVNTHALIALLYIIIFKLSFCKQILLVF